MATADTVGGFSYTKETHAADIGPLHLQLLAGSRRS